METMEMIELGILALGAMAGGTYVLPAKYAKIVGLGFKIFKKIGEFGEKLEKSEGGFSIKPEVEVLVKDEIFTKASKVLASKSEMFTPEDTKAILTQISKSKGVTKIQFKIKDFIQSI